MCSTVRKEGAGSASERIREGVAATRAFYGDPPEMRMVTFIDPKKVKPTMTHVAPTWGRTYELAGFEHVGKTKGGLLAMQLRPEKMPLPAPANGMELRLEHGADIGIKNRIRCPGAQVLAPGSEHIRPKKEARDHTHDK